MNFAIVRIKNTQYKVSKGDEVLVGKLNDEKVEPEVLLYSENDKVEVGKPLLKKRNVKIKVLEGEVKGDKLHVFTFKSKSRYRRKIGFRPKYTKIRVEKLS